MPRIKTKELLDRIDNGQFTSIRLSGLQDGTFFMMLEGADGTFIHENSDGSVKEYPRADDALKWLKRTTRLNEITVDIELWRSDVTGQF